MPSIWGSPVQERHWYTGWSKSNRSLGWLAGWSTHWEWKCWVCSSLRRKGRWEKSHYYIELYLLGQYKEDRVKLFLEISHEMMRGNGHYQQHGKFWLDTGKNFWWKWSHTAQRACVILVLGDTQSLTEEDLEQYDLTCEADQTSSR